MTILRSIPCALLFLTSCCTALAQQPYRAGFARESTEPGALPFSLTLAGYGAPVEGRFSLDWIKAGEAGSNCTAFTGMTNTLLKVSNDELFTAATGSTPPAWKKTGSAAGIRLLAGGKNKLYAVNTQGDLLVAGNPGKPAWKKTGTIPNAVALTILHNTLYAATTEGTILTANVSAAHVSWKAVKALENVTSLAANGNYLYALTAQDNLFRYNPSTDSSWLKIARYNGITYDVKLQHVAIAGNSLYGCDAAGNIFKAKHNSEGSMSASAFAVSSGKQNVVVVGLDVCGFDHVFILGVKQEISRKYHIPAEAVLINASHTHYSPVAQPYPAWEPHCQQPDSAYLYGIAGPAIVRAVGGAIRNLAPSTLYFGRGKTEIGSNRCLTTAPIPYDNDVDVITAVRNDNQEKTVLFLTGCHAVFSGNGRPNITLSANFPGAARADLEGKEGIAHSVFIQGCAGDINPKDQDYMTTGRDLSADVQQVIAGPMEKITGRINFYIDTMLFPVKPMATREAAVTMHQESAKHAGEMIPNRNFRWANIMLHYYDDNTMPANMPVYLQTINIGNWKLVGLSREVVTEYSAGIKALFPGKLVSVAGYSNDVSSYLPTSRHIKAGTYEGIDSFVWYGQPSLFPENVYETVLDHIRHKNR